MDQQPDKLFREKLQGYDSPVPPQLWDRVADNVQPKRRKMWWLSAAAVALIGTTTVFLYPSKKESAPLAETVARPTPQEQAPPSGRSDTHTVPAEQATPRKNNPIAQADADKQTPGRKTIVPKNESQRAIGREEIPVIAMPEPEAVALAKEEPILPAVTEETITQEVSSRKTITLVFTAKEVNEKYLSKTDPARATSEAEEASTLKNMLDKAYDLTHNQNPLGELRQKKNEILAMNFRKDKPRTQND